MTENESPFLFEINPSSLETMLSWAKMRIVSGPDPTSGAKSVSFFDKELGDSINKDGLGCVGVMKLNS